ncbi:MAG: winged helix-turn-helix transcriptional regulator [Candidatus Bathyarchaeia archaeon]
MKPQEKVEIEAKHKILKAFYDCGELLTFKQLVDKTGMSRRTLAKHLKRMEQQGEISIKHIGGKARIAYQLVHPISLSRKLVEELNLLCVEPLTEQQIEDGVKILSKKLLDIVEEYLKRCYEIGGMQTKASPENGKRFEKARKNLLRKLSPINVFSLLYCVDLYKVEKQRFSEFPDILERAYSKMKTGDQLETFLRRVCERPEEYFLYKLVLKHGLEEKFDRLVEWIDGIKNRIPLYDILDDWMIVRMGLQITLNLLEGTAGIGIKTRPPSPEEEEILKWLQ